MRFSTNYYMKAKYKQTDNFLVKWINNNEGSFLVVKKRNTKRKFMKERADLNVTELFVLKIIDSLDSFTEKKDY